MPKITAIQSPKNPLVQALKKLKRKPPFEEGKVILEGVRLIEEAKRAGLRFEILFFTTAFQASDLVKNVQTATLVSDSVMKEVSLESTPPGLWALVEVPRSQLDYQRDFIVLCGVRDPGNAGTLVRTAEATGCSVFFSSDSVHPFHPKVVKGSMGSSFRTPLFQGDVLTFLRDLKTKSWDILGTKTTGAISYAQWPWKKRFALLLGSEAHGLPESLTSVVDADLQIPLAGDVESLNVAVSAAVILFHSRLAQAQDTH